MLNIKSDIKRYASTIRPIQFGPAYYRRIRVKLIVHRLLPHSTRPKRQKKVSTVVPTVSTKGRERHGLHPPTMSNCGFYGNIVQWARAFTATEVRQVGEGLTRELDWLKCNVIFGFLSDKASLIEPANSKRSDVWRKFGTNF